MSKDGTNWTTLYTHMDDSALNDPGNTATWSVEINDKEETQGWRHVRIQQNGKNASGQTHYLSLSGFEIYGTVTGVCEDLGEFIILIGLQNHLLLCDYIYDYRESSKRSRS